MGVRIRVGCVLASPQSCVPSTHPSAQRGSRSRACGSRAVRRAVPGKETNASPAGTCGSGRVEPLCPLVVAQHGSARGPCSVGARWGCPHLGVAPGGQRLAAALAA